MSCIFCKIAGGEIKAEKIFETPSIIVFNDIHPVAPVHMLVVTKKHYETLNDIPENDPALNDIFKAIRHITKTKGIDKNGYRVVVNAGKDGGQEIRHFHLHIIGGKKMGPMG